MLRRGVSAGEYLCTMSEVTRLDNGEGEGGEGSNAENKTKRGRKRQNDKRGERSKRIQGKKEIQSTRVETKKAKFEIEANVNPKTKQTLTVCRHKYKPGSTFVTCHAIMPLKADKRAEERY